MARRARRSCGTGPSGAARLEPGALRTGERSTGRDQCPAGPAAGPPDDTRLARDAGCEDALGAESVDLAVEVRAVESADFVVVRHGSGSFSVGTWGSFEGD